MIRRYTATAVMVWLAFCPLFASKAMGGSWRPMSQRSPFKRKPLVVGYFTSWSDHRSHQDAGKTQLANVAEEVNVVNVAFIRPDLHYKSGSLSLQGTGLSFGYSGKVLKEAIRLLHERHPETKVILSVGGAGSYAWHRLNIDNIAHFIQDFGFDGVDIDFEPVMSHCNLNAQGQRVCRTDDQIVQQIRDFRKALPRPRYIVSVAAWSVGAYGEGEFASTLPIGSNRGVMINPLKEAGDDIDLVNVMSYDAGKYFHAEEALAAYRHYYKGPIAMGVEVGRQAWGGGIYSMSAVESLANASQKDALQHNQSPAIMLWSLQKPGSHTSDAAPSSGRIVNRVCQIFGGDNCTKKVIS